MKDYIKIDLCLEYLHKHIKNFDKIYLVTPNLINKSQLEKYNIEYFNDKDVLNINPMRWKYRPNWIYQQFIKLFQNITKNDYYFTIDADVIVNKDINMFNDNGKPIWYYGKDQNHAPYFNFQEKMLGFGRIANHTFINDTNFFNKNIIKDMLNRYKFTVQTFIEKSYDIIDNSCYLGEPELYGNYVLKYYPDMYDIIQLKTTNMGKSQKNPFETVYSINEINKFINKNKEYDIIVVHSWYNGSYNCWE
jgi:hypothetical protein